MNSFWDIINVPFGYVLRFCNRIGQNQYILALLLFAIIIEIVLLPFGIKQQKNSIKQARLRPKEMAIRKKYKGRNDRPTQQKMTMEIQELYQKEGYNPMGGCLPLLIQFPIIIALYNIVMSPLQYICGLSKDAISQIIEIVKKTPEFAERTFTATRNVDLIKPMKEILAKNPNAFNGVDGFSDKIGSASELPNLTLFGGAIDLGAIPSFQNFNWLLLIPLLTFLVYFASMKLNRKLMYQPMEADKAMGCSNNVMDVVMPLFSVYICFIVPAAIGVYWIFKSILGVLKQLILKATMPIPVFTEEDYKAAEKEMNARAPKGPKNKSGKIVRSLHHIDDEDFEDTAEAARERRLALEAQESKNKPQSEEDTKPSLMDGAKLKEDDKPQPKAKRQKKADTAATDEPTDNENHTDGE